MGNKINRHDPATAIPLLEKMLKALEKKQGNIEEEIKNIEQSTPSNNLYRVDIFATRGNFIQSVVDSTDLEARLYSWDNDITEDAEEEWFRWTRISGDTEADTEWNNSHGIGRKIITVFEQDVISQATFMCTVNDGDDIFTEAQIVVSCDYSQQQDITDAIQNAIDTSTQITENILTGYTTVEDLQEYAALIQSQLLRSNEGFAFEFETFKRTLDELNNEIVLQKSYIRLIEGNIYVGNYDSLISTVYTQNGLEIRYGDVVVARYTNEVLEVKNVNVDNQVSYFEQWAIRKGAYIDGVGYNLNDMWIGG